VAKSKESTDQEIIDMVRRITRDEYDAIGVEWMKACAERLERANKRDDFAKGVACCVSWLIKAHGEDGLALEMFLEMGTKLDQCDSFDTKAIRKAVKADSRYEIVNDKLVRK
jgi:hypothetical protein